MTGKKLKITILSSSYPTKEYPHRDVFIHDEALIVSTFSDINVLLTGAYSLPFTDRYKKYWNTLAVKFDYHKIKYFSFPRITFPKITQYFYQRNIQKFLRYNHPDLVHAHFAYPSAFALPVIAKHGIRSVLTIHGVDFQLCIGKPSIENLLYHNLQYADAIIAVGPKLRDEIVEFCPEVKHKTLVMLHGIDTEFFSIPKTKRDVISDLDWDPDKTHVLCVARVVHKKGHDLLLAAIHRLGAQSKNVVFHMVGEISDIKWYQHLITYLKNNNIDNVLFYEPQDRNQLLKYYQAADFYVQPSRDEPFGLAVAEAGSCGLPVLSTKSGGPEVIITPETGIIVNADENSLTEGLSQMLKRYRDFDGETISESVRNRFSIRHKKESLESLYSKILMQ
jgi:L-malate glycosyltransferase